MARSLPSWRGVPGGPKERAVRSGRVAIQSWHGSIRDRGRYSGEHRRARCVWSHCRRRALPASASIRPRYHATNPPTPPEEQPRVDFGRGAADPGKIPPRRSIARSSSRQGEAFASTAVGLGLRDAQIATSPNLGTRARSLRVLPPAAGFDHASPRNRPYSRSEARRAHNLSEYLLGLRWVQRGQRPECGGL